MSRAMPISRSDLESHCDTLRHTATHCNSLQLTATHCNTLQSTATHRNLKAAYVSNISISLMHLIHVLHNADLEIRAWIWRSTVRVRTSLSLSPDVCIRVSGCVCLRVHVPEYISVRACICVSVCASMCLCISECMCVFVCVCV